MKDTHLQRENIILSQSMSPPAVRMVIVATWLHMEPDDERPAFFSYPVIAIRTDFLASYSKEVAIGYFAGTPSNIGDMEDNGWRFDGRETRTHAVICDEEYGIIDADDPLMFDGAGFEHELLLLPWDFNKDADDDAILKVWNKQHLSLQNKRERLLKKKATAEQAAQGFQKMREAAQ